MDILTEIPVKNRIILENKSGAIIPLSVNNNIVNAMQAKAMLFKSSLFSL